MARNNVRFRLLVEDFDRNVEVEVVNIYNYLIRENILVLYTKDEGQRERTETIYNTRNFRTLTLEPMED